ARPSHAALNTHGAALYRAGRFDAAVRRLEEAVAAPGNSGAAWDWLFLAMAHQRQGHGDEARRCLEKAVRWIDQAEAATTRDRPPRTPLGWQQRLELQILRREAEELVMGKPSPAPAERPVGWQVHLARAEAYLALSEPANAVAAAARATELQPGSLQA